MKRWSRVFIFGLILLGLLTACRAAEPAAVRVQPTESNPIETAVEETDVDTENPEGTIFVVVLTDGTSIPVTIDQLKTLPLGTVKAEGKVEEGPRIEDVLNFVGVGNFSSVKLTGINGDITLSSEVVYDDAVLDFTNHGTVKLATASVAKDEWIKDISIIEVQ